MPTVNFFYGALMQYRFTTQADYILAYVGMSHQSDPLLALIYIKDERGKNMMSYPAYEQLFCSNNFVAVGCKISKDETSKEIPYIMVEATFYHTDAANGSSIAPMKRKVGMNLGLHLLRTLPSVPLSDGSLLKPDMIISEIEVLKNLNFKLDVKDQLYSMKD